MSGLEIDNDMTDLPLEKGLSSSAAVCVLVARAFNVLYDLKVCVGSDMCTLFVLALFQGIMYIVDICCISSSFIYRPSLISRVALQMTIRGEMEYAYQGEILTPSKCGRMDQGCAYGSRLVQ